MTNAPLNPDAIHELTEAIRLTVEYVGTGMLPAIPGWSWYDAMVKYAPDDAETLRTMARGPELAAAQPVANSVEELVTTHAGRALANAAFNEGVHAGIRACNESLEGEPFVKPVSPYRPEANN